MLPLPLPKLCLHDNCWINGNILDMFSAVIWVHLGLLRLSSRGSFRRSIRFIIFSRGQHLLCYDVACCKLSRLSSMGVSCGIAMTINYVGYV